MSGILSLEDYNSWLDRLQASNNSSRLSTPHYLFECYKILKNILVSVFNKTSFQKCRKRRLTRVICNRLSGVNCFNHFREKTLSIVLTLQLHPIHHVFARLTYTKHRSKVVLILWYPTIYVLEKIRSTIKSKALPMLLHLYCDGKYQSTKLSTLIKYLNILPACSHVTHKSLIDLKKHFTVPSED